MRMTADYLNAHGAADQIVYAYSTGTEPRDQASYLERYPGHDLIDVLGFDAYQREDKDFFLKSMDTSLSVIDSIGKANHKIIAITETGYEGVPDSTWWTGTCCLPWRNIRSLMYWYGETPVKKSLTSLALIPDKPLPRISRSSLKIRKHCSPPISTYINNIIHKPDKSRHIQL